MSSSPIINQSAGNFDDLHPRFSEQQAAVESDRCLFCYDAPCVAACPTAIDIPQFIRRISTQNAEGAAHTILQSNIMGGTCARACPTEVLCEQQCVLNAKEGEPVKIGRLQRFAVDHHMRFREKSQPFKRWATTGKRVAVVGSGPAGLSCAHQLARYGHDVVVFDSRDKPGGLNEYGLASYKMANDYAQTEVDYILEIGGIELKTGVHVGTDQPLADLERDFDAVFVGIGLSTARTVDLPGAQLTGVRSAIDFIAELRQSTPGRLPHIDGPVIVIGGGNTAIDAAIQAKRLGVAEVHLVYRRGPEFMSATKWEQKLAATEGVFIRHWQTPVEFLGDQTVNAARFVATSSGETDEQAMVIEARTVLLAIGQVLESNIDFGLEMDNGKIVVDGNYMSSRPGVFAGGDCTATGDDLTVQAVEDGKQAAERINDYLSRSS